MSRTHTGRHLADTVSVPSEKADPAQTGCGLSNIRATRSEGSIPRLSSAASMFDDSKNPFTLWIGSNHGASIVKVEPHD